MEHILIALLQLIFSKLLPLKKKNTIKQFLSSWPIILINMCNTSPGFVAVMLLLLLLFSPFICISMLLAFQISLLNALTVTENCWLVCALHYHVVLSILEIFYLRLQIYRLFKAILFFLISNFTILLLSSPRYWFLDL